MNRVENAVTECKNILEQLGLSSSDLGSEETECWEKKASTAQVDVNKEEEKSLMTDNMFNMLGLSEADMQSSSEAWESKTII